MFLKEKGIDNYDDLVKKSSAASAEFASRNKKIKEAETRMAEITELQKQIWIYGKTRDAYNRYKKSGFDKDLYESERADITLHQAAKKYFDERGYGKNNPLPKMDALKQEWATLAAEKKKLYSGYREAKTKMVDLLTAKSNADKILGVAPERNASRSQNRSNSHDR